MIKLKDILLESETQQDISNKLKDIAKELQAAASKAKQSPKDDEVNEGLLTLISLVVGAPGLLTFLGKAADGLADVIKTGSDAAVFKKSTYKKGGSKNIPPSIGSGLIKAGHALEDVYINSLGGWLQTAYPSKYQGQDVEDHSSDLHKDSHKIYAGLLIAGAAAAGYEAIHAANMVVKGFEGGAAALKTKEVADIAQKISSV